MKHLPETDPLDNLAELSISSIECIHTESQTLKLLFLNDDQNQPLLILSLLRQITGPLLSLTHKPREQIIKILVKRIVKFSMLKNHNILHLSFQ